MKKKHDIDQKGFVRIIAGKWRGRRLQIPNKAEVRPTPDRVRETLFNWLAPHIVHAHCLDAFAGTGALGFEALSRGASSVEMIDQSPHIIAMLKSQVEKLAAGELVTLYQARFPEEIHSCKKPFDIVFLDPPYHADLLLSSCYFLEEKGYLAQSAYIYLEAKELIQEIDLPRNWELIKAQKAGQVAYHLAHRKKSNA